MSSVIVGYARTPFVKYCGQFATLPATELGAIAARGALAKAGVDAADVDAVLAGQVLQGGAGQNPARQTAVGAGISMDVPAITLNAVCLSGTEAVAQADRLVRLGEAKVVLAVGQESMSLAPHVAPLRAGTKYGDATFIDTVAHDGLTDAFERQSMGASTEGFAGKAGISRERQDEIAARSHRLATDATEKGVFADEIVPVEVTVRRATTEVAVDDGMRADTTVDTLAGLRPAFAKDGTITAGNASQVSDGAAALVIADEAWARERGLTPLARIRSHALVAGPDVSLLSQPSNAIAAAAEKAGVAVKDLANVEINEAFAAVSAQSVDDLGVDPEIVNIHGGAIALGHPIGASGARIVGHLARQLAWAGAGTLGAAGICGGGGQGSAIVLEAV